METETGIVIFGSSILLHSALLFISKHVLQNKFTSITNNQSLWSAANWSVSFLQATLATLVGFSAVLYTRSDILHTQLSFLKPYAWFSIGYWFYDLVCLYVIVSMERKDTSRGLITNIINFIQWWPGIVFHHIGILVFLSLGILYTSRVRGDGIVGFSLLMELSSIFVALRSLLAKLELKSTKLYLQVSIIMVITFFFSRIFLLPYVVHLYCSQSNLGLLEGINSLPILCKLGTFSFYSLNLYWFYLMLKGCVKAIKNGGIKND